MALMRLLCVCIALLLAAQGNAAFFQGSVNGSGAPASFTPVWQSLRVGGGGQITGIYEAPEDGTLVARVDTYGAYVYRTSGTCPGWGTVYSAPCWQQLVTASSIPSPTITYPNDLFAQAGAAEIAVCNKTTGGASATNIAYMIWDFKVWVTTNLNSTSVNWTATTQGALQNPNTGNDKAQGSYLYCDPNNPDVVYVSNTVGVFYSTNGTSGGSATFTQATGLGAGVGTWPDIIAADYNSTVSGNISQTFYIAVQGDGVYQTTNGGSAGGGSFTKTTSGPTGSQHMCVDNFHQLWVADSSTNLKVLASGTWSNSTSGGTPIAVACDLTSASLGANHIVASRASSADLIYTNDNGSMWSGPGFSQTVSATAPQPIWLQNANQQSAGLTQLNPSGIALDPSGNAWTAGGIGIWEAAAPLVTNTVWKANTLGVEQLVGIYAFAPAGLGPFTNVWDKGFFGQLKVDTFPTTYWTTAADEIMGGWSLDWVSSQTTTVVGWETDNIGGGEAPAVSTDGGNSWTAWGSLPATRNHNGGVIAASTPMNWALIPGSSQQINYTTDGGTTWNIATVPGSPTNWTGSAGVGVPLAADRVTANAFCAYRASSGVALYSSVNSGANWIASLAGGTIDGNLGTSFLLGMPGEAGVFFFSAGGQSGGAHPTSTHLWKITKSTNECDTAASVGGGNLLEVIAFGYGAAKPGTSHATIYAYGWFSSVLGFYESNDVGATWNAISVPLSQAVWANNSLDYMTYLYGDMNVYGRIYATFKGSGSSYIDTQDACPYANFSNVLPGASLTGTVTLSAAGSGLVPVTSVQFSVDGTNIGAAQTGSSPYSVNWNTGGVATGAHTLKVQAVGNGCTTSGNSFSIPITTH